MMQDGRTQASEADQIEARRKALIKNAGALRIFLPKAKVIQPKHNPRRPKAGGKGRAGTFGPAGPVRHIKPVNDRTAIPGHLPCSICGTKREEHTITTAYPDGREGLMVHSFCSTDHAHQGGFTWVTPIA
jgi:hypothetical protein